MSNARKDMRKISPYTLLLKINMVLPQKLTIERPPDPVSPLMGVYTKEMKSAYRDRDACP